MKKEKPKSLTETPEYYWRNILDKIKDIIISGVHDDILRVTFLDNRTIAQYGDPIADAQSFVKVMSDENNSLMQLILQAQ